MRVNVYGHLSSGFGLAGGAAATIRLLRLAGCDVQHYNLQLNSHPSLTSTPDGVSSEQTAVGCLDLVHTNPNILSVTENLLNPESLHAPLRIGYWAWELETFPHGWEDFFEHYDEIWCPSSFTAQTLIARSPIPVVSVPHLPDWQTLDQANQRRDQDLTGIKTDASTTRFLCCFDYWSTTARKNPQSTITAFKKAFQNTTNNVELILKSSTSNQFPEEHARLKRLTAHDSRIRWIDQLLSHTEMMALLSSADVFVSLHRSEGFGLVIADAMALGIPVIATGYSGNLEFMPPGSAYLIPWQWSAIPSSSGDYPQGSRWAEPSIGSAAQAMQNLAHSPEHRKRLGLAGRRAVKERLAPERLVPIVKQRLGTLLMHPSRRELKTAQSLQQTPPHGI